MHLRCPNEELLLPYPRAGLKPQPPRASRPRPGKKSCWQPANLQVIFDSRIYCGPYAITGLQ